MTQLNRKERSWLRKLQHVLDDCPSDRIGFYTIGDHAIMLYNRTKDEEINDMQDHGQDFCTAVNMLDAGFDVDLEFPSNVHSTAG